MSQPANKVQGAMVVVWVDEKVCIAPISQEALPLFMPMLSAFQRQDPAHVRTDTTLVPLTPALSVQATALAQEIVKVASKPKNLEADMKERPILFSGAMVQAILAGTKTQTRRAVALPRKRQGFVVVDHGKGWWPYQSDDGESELCDDGCEHPYASPYGLPGDQLWVRETWQHANHPDGPWDEDTPVFYRADYLDDPDGPDGEKSREGRYRSWRPAIHMPRGASRINLEITQLRVERLQDITAQDCLAEGITAQPREDFYGDQRLQEQHAYATLWEQINGKGSWATNPWVWVIEFKHIPTTEQPA